MTSIISPHPPRLICRLNITTNGLILIVSLDRPHPPFQTTRFLLQNFHIHPSHSFCLVFTRTLSLLFSWTSRGLSVLIIKSSSTLSVGSLLVVTGKELGLEQL